MKLHHTVIFIFSVIALLAIVCATFPQPSLSVGGLTLHFPSIEKMLSITNNDTLRTAEQMLMEAEQSLSMTVADSAAQAQADSLAFYHKFFAESPMRIFCPNNNPEYLFSFFDALDNARSEGVHVMHYGDSQIEGDRISGYLRSTFQKRFGGMGPGFIPLYQPIAAMNVQQSLSDSVSMYYAGGMMGSRAQHNRYGAMAQMAQISTSDTVRMAIKSYRGKSFGKMIIFAGKVDSALTFSAASKVLHFMPSSQMLQQSINFKHPLGSIEANVCGVGEIYGIYLSGTNGVNVSNIPMRGSDGTFFSRIDKDAFKRMLNVVNTRLIIMEFGGNALPMISDTISADRWCKRFRAQVEHMRKMVPNAKILVIGPADMSVKVNGELQTHAMLPYLTQKMRQEVLAGGAAFWDMYAVMGGPQSMIAWVDHSPAWAATDYVHFTKKGADRISEVLCEAIDIYYSYRDYIKHTQQQRCTK